MHLRVWLGARAGTRRSGESAFPPYVGIMAGLAACYVSLELYEEGLLPPSPPGVLKQVIPLPYKLL